MSDRKFTWELAADSDEWDKLVELSPQGTLFSERLFLDLAGCPYDLFVIRQGRQAKAGVCILRTPDGRGSRLDDLVIHNGIMFAPDETKKPVRQRFEAFDLTAFAIDELVARYRRIELALAPQFSDLRPFLWHNYHDADACNKFVLDLRYTSYLNIGDLAADIPEEDTAAFRAMETLRQRHVRDAARKGGMVRLGSDGAVLIEFYRTLMARQGDATTDEKLTRMRQLVDGLVDAGRAAVYEVLNAAGTIIYVTAYGWDAKRAYYLFGAGHPEAAEPWQGTLAHWSAFKDLARRAGIREVDLEGVNSPQRGWFKLGLGGDLRPYYQVYLGAME